MSAVEIARRQHDDAGSPTPARPVRLGVTEWFRPGEHERVEHLIDGLHRIGVTDVRIGISWAGWRTEEGRAWCGWLLPRLARDLSVLPCFAAKAPSPDDLGAYADFVDAVIREHGTHFEWVELGTEPDGLASLGLDTGWDRFAAVVNEAAGRVRRHGKRTVLGGVSATDPDRLATLTRCGALDGIDALGLRALPETGQADGPRWLDLIARVRDAWCRHDREPQLWLTEVGYATWHTDEARQMARFLEAVAAPVDRVYWYRFRDLDPAAVPSREGRTGDEGRHFGLVRADGTPKLLYRLLAKGGIDLVRRVHAAERAVAPLRRRQRRTVITGGAGFIGANLADRLAREGRRVLIYDNLGRPGVEENMAWLRERYGARVAVEIADVRDADTLRDAVGRAEEVFHLAAQVAVTTSIGDPVADFEVNARGTLNLLEAARAAPEPPPLVFTSTNKVYGGLRGLSFASAPDGYRPADAALGARGIAENQPLDFCSPYGCSKGAADQYVLDYARIYRLPATVFRMSCIYGPRQFGTEDQGWVAHFLIRALNDEPITIYGDGHQVRDILFIDDLVEALLLARTRIARTAGRPFNIGGGPGNTTSLLRLLNLIARLNGHRPEIAFGPWRPGDQVYYVSDIRAFQAVTGWQPRVGVESGVTRLWRWLQGASAGRERERAAEGAVA